MHYRQPRGGGGGSSGLDANYPPTNRWPEAPLGPWTRGAPPRYRGLVPNPPPPPPAGWGARLANPNRMGAS